jgi:hypothetical protein
MLRMLSVELRLIDDGRWRMRNGDSGSVMLLGERRDSRVGALAQRSNAAFEIEQ